MKKNIIVFVFILLMCIGLQYETLYYIDGSMSEAEYGVMGLSILVALFLYGASYLLSISYWEKMGNIKEGINPVLAGWLIYFRLAI